MPINCLVNRRVKETKRRRDKETKRGGLPQPLPKGKGFVAALMHRTWGSFLETKRRRDKKRKRGRERKGEEEEEGERRKDRFFET